jgi:hypothetical protein
MILILHNNEPSTISFIKYLTDRNRKHISLSIEEIIKHIFIYDKIFPNKKNSKRIWYYKDLEIDFKNIRGIYNRINQLDIRLFDDFVLEDRFYVLNEWWAYLLYIINNTDNVLNKITKEMASGQIYQFPYIFHQAKNFKFKTPHYFLSNSIDKLRSRAKHMKIFITRKSLYDNRDFRAANVLNDDDIGIMEYVEGSYIFIHIIDDLAYCSKWENGIVSSLEIDNRTINQSILLVKNLKLTIAEIILKKTAKCQFIFYNLSPFPNWLYASHDNQSKIYENLYLKLYDHNIGR